jgi:hypothetical protein
MQPDCCSDGARLARQPATSFACARRWLGWIAIGLGLLASAAQAQVPRRAPDHTLEGQLMPADSASYRNLDFDLPAGTSRLVVALSHDGDPKASLIELGIADPQGFRGASSRKTDFTLSATDATPGYLPGRLPAGSWQLRFSVGFLPPQPLHWHVRLWFMKPGEILPANVPTRGVGWYRGDLHVHSDHSDGSCPSLSDLVAPCPLYPTIAFAAERKLDFLMVTEHNTVSQLQVLRELQPHFDKTLLIPGQEVTTFYGHINVWGVDQPIDYRIAPGLRTFNKLADQVHAAGGLLSINHPMAPTGTNCLGCGWSMPDVDYAKVDAVEAINGGVIALTGGNPEGAVSGIPFWLKRLAAGNRLVAVGGSDSHGVNPADHPPAVGNPTTVVYAQDLTQTAILDGIRSGRVFIDLAMDPTSLLDLALRDGEQRVAMGGRMQAHAPVTAEVQVLAPPGATLQLLDGDRLLVSKSAATATPGTPLAIPLTLSKGSHGVRAVVRDASGKILLFSNAVLVTMP